MSYGGLYSTAILSIALTSASKTLPIATLMPQNNVVYGENNITISESGDYEIGFLLAGSTSENTHLTVGVMQNSRTLPGSLISMPVTKDTSTLFGNTFICSLVAGDTLVLRAASSADVTFSPAPNVNTSLTVKQLSSAK